MRPIPPRTVAGSGLETALDLLTPPFAAAAIRDELTLTGGRFAVEGPRRHPALLVRLRMALARTAVLVHAEVNGEQLAPVVFGAYTAAGSVLPLYVPRLPAGSDGTGSFTVRARVWHVDGADAAAIAHDAEAVLVTTGPPLSDADAATLVDGIVLDGLLSRMVYLSTLEKQRLLAAAREVTAARHVALARGAALDAHGADLAVPRLADEPDDRYRTRLAVYSSWRLATPAGFSAALNGPGSPEQPAAGLPATVGVTSRFRVLEQAGQLAIAVRLVQVGADVPARERFAGLLTGGLLADLDAAPPTQLPAATRERLTRVRATLTGALSRTGGGTRPRYMTTLTATSLARAVLLLELLTGDGSLSLLRAWTATPDPRHELGLGVTVRRVTATRLGRAVTAARAARDAAAAGERVQLPGADGDVDPELLAAIVGAEPRDTADDPLGAWLFSAAGMATVTAPDDKSVYLSPLPSMGLVVEGPEQVAPGATAEFVARLRQDDSTGRHVLVDEAWQRARAPLAEAGGNPILLAPEELRTALEELSAAAPDLPVVLSPLASIGLAPALPGELATRILEAYDLDLLLGVHVDDPVGAVNPESDPARELRDRMIARSDALTAAGFHSVRVLPAPSGDGVLLLGALSVLPGGSNRPGEPPPAAYRWYVTELPAVKGGATLELQRGAGGRVTVRGRRAGLALLVCVAYARRGLPDPYEVRVELPGDDVLSLEQYGYVMNLLEHLCPLGIEINTFDLRRNHVSVDGGEPTFLSSRVSRSYTRFRRRRPDGADRYPDADPPRR
ncbi:hypothetical protein [Micromonospora sp. NPDC049679]|uniref:hypothetical protein n=1 Tax=Micromonospora sp. NPDC049679 TaxID=3155920 RepID=UPI0033FD81DD